MSAAPDATPPPSPDRDLIRQHLGLIAADERQGLIEIAWTDADGAGPHHARLFNVADLDEAADFAVARNSTVGVNVYVGAALRRENAARARRAKASDVLGTCVLWFDADRDAKAVVIAAMQTCAKPTVLVRTGEVPELRLHGYWQLPQLLTDHAVITQQLKAIVAHLSTDPAVTSPAQLLRLAGCVAWPKKAGRVAELVGYRKVAGTPYVVPLEALAAAFPPGRPRERPAPDAAEREPSGAPDDIVGPITLQELRSALSVIPSDDRTDWVAVANALVLLGKPGRRLFDEWSAKSSKYDPVTQELVWRSAKGERTGYRAIFAKAMELGWQNPMSREPGAGGDPAPVTPVRASDLLMDPPADRRWLVPNLIPAGQVTELRGDGGAGKSTLALQLCVSAVAGVPWLGMTIEHGGPAFYLASEDDADELHRRLSAICERVGVEGAALTDFHIWPLATEDPALADLSANRISETARWGELGAHIERYRPAVLVLDSRADVFAGEEINRRQVIWFIAKLRKLAVRTGAAVVILAHPSQSGKTDGTGNSGSTHWGNAVRSALYLKVVKDEERDNGRRLLSVVKSNYGPPDLNLPLRWMSGAIVSLHAGVRPLSPDEERSKVDGLFLSLLDKCEAQGRIVSDRSGPNFAPAVFARMPGGAEVTSEGFKRAMERLFEDNRIRVVRVGRPTNGRWKLDRVTANMDFGEAQANEA